MPWDPKIDYRTLSVPDLGALMMAARLKKEIADAASSDATAEYDFLRKVAMPKAMERAGMKSLRLADGQGITTKEEMYVSVKAGNAPAFIEWLDAHGEGDMAKRTVNAQTLKSWYKTGLKEGRELPYELVSATTATVAQPFK